MLYNIIGRNLDVTDGLKDAIHTRLSKLDKYFTNETKAQVTLSVQKNRQKIEVTIPTKKGLIRAEQTTDDMYISIDKVTDIIVRQIKKYKSKLIDKKQNAPSFSEYFINDEIEEVDENDILISKLKRFEIKPMTPEEACLQMEMLGHNFFVFIHDESNEVAVVYKRAGGDFGLIIPER